MSQHDRYISPFSTRYSSDEMQYIFSDDNKFRTWRRLWVALARAEMEQGLTNITPDMVAELEAHVDDINYEVAIEREKLVRHDVMSHVYAYGQQCPKAAGIIHLGATSCYVGDNTDIILMREGMALLRDKLVRILAALGKFADQYKALPTLGYTHYQAAQMVTVGKRATLWMNELLMDLEELEYRMDHLKMLGCKGTTGTQASFLELFGGGKAALELEDPEDILNCGIEIKAQPPGKTLKTISLLSGGEKAFVAIALYFAILKVRPTPFVVMDEIEAALDDSNVDRYAGYLHKLTKYTQFIVITHRRGTMVAADRLYGITMQEKGVSTLVSVNLIEDSLTK